jgi:hypothetical protein
VSKAAYNKLTISLYAAVTAFCFYAAVFAFRKPFTIATFGGQKFGGIEYQTLLIVSQAIGYMCAKFYGIPFISSLNLKNRWRIVLVLVCVIWGSLLLFAVLPAPWGIPCMLINGFPLGLMWGLVFSYVEGRTTTDFIGSALAVSFIFSSGFVKSIGKYILLNWQVTEQWMPFVTAALFVVPLLILLYALERIPPPDAEDFASRSQRTPMNNIQRIGFVNQYFTGVAALLTGYLFLTIVRDIRDNFMGNFWNEMGQANNASIFSSTEVPVTLCVLVFMGAMVFIKRHALVLRLMHWVIVGGCLLSAASTWLFLQGELSAYWWMVLIGLGLYLAYIPFNSIYFDRFIAAFKIQGNVGFLIYTADSAGYVGSVGVMLMKAAFSDDIQWSEFFPVVVIVCSLIALFGFLLMGMYVFRRMKREGV